MFINSAFIIYIVLSIVIIGLVKTGVNDRCFNCMD